MTDAPTPQPLDAEADAAPHVPVAPEPFRAYYVEQDADGRQQGGLRELPRSALPEGEVLLRVARSSLDYKDGLAVTGSAPILRRFPIVPGVDLAGTVLESASPRWRPGDRVILTGWEIGERHWGGYAQLAVAQADWLVPLPTRWSFDQGMAVGTAGFTAMLAVMLLEEHGLRPGDGDVVVTGASGGVGGMAVALLAALGHRVVASTGRTHEAPYLEQLGAADVVHRDTLAEPPSKGLGSARWAGAVDTVGDTTLATLLATTRLHGSVAACGLAAGPELRTTVYPFILRGVNLLGVDSNYCPPPRRRLAWRRLDRELPADVFDAYAQTAPLSDIDQLAAQILRGEIRGRTVIDVDR